MNTPQDTHAEAEVLATMREHSDTMMAGDVDTLLSYYSQDWQNNQGADKDSLKDTIIAGGSRTIDMSDAEAVVDGDSAFVTPVTHTTSKGYIIYTHTLKKEADNVWRLVFTQTIDWENIPLDDDARKRKTTMEAWARASRDFREQVLSDPHRPGYHFVMPEGFGSPFDPNGAIYWKGRYHLFYIFQDMRPVSYTHLTLPTTPYV